MRHRALTASFIALACWTSTAAQAQTQSGTTLTPDGVSYLVSKDVGAERWAISLNLVFVAGIGTTGEPRVIPTSMTNVTGNVFMSDGGPPSFVFCQVKDPKPNILEPGAEFHLMCRGAGRCEETARACAQDAWEALIAEDLVIPATFFFPPGGAGSLAVRLALVQPSVWERVVDALFAVRWQAMKWIQPAPGARLRSGRGAPAGASSLRGVTATLDGLNFLVNKDIADQRWSISMNFAPTETQNHLAENQLLSVTGNIYQAAGGAPSFVYCQERDDSMGDLSVADSTFRFRCMGTDTCTTTAEDCAKNAWRVIADDVPLTAEFFLPPGGLPPPPVSDAAVFVESRGFEPPIIGSTEYTVDSTDSFASASASSCSEGRGCTVPRVGGCENVAGNLRAFGPTCRCVIDDLDPRCITCGAAPTSGTCGQACSYPVGTLGPLARGLCLPFRSDQPACICYAIGRNGRPSVENCGGTLGTTCPGDRCCTDDPSDGCLPQRGDLTCAGVCVEAGGCDPSAEQCGSCAVPACGNGRIDPAEDCDGNDLGGRTCQSVTGGTGTLTCGDRCKFDTSGCAGCGNDRVEGDEQCDGSDLAGASCALFDRGDGTLGCNLDCTFAVTGCAESRPCEDIAGPACLQGIQGDPSRPFDLRTCTIFDLCSPSGRVCSETGTCE